MANRNVDSELLKKFEDELIDQGKKRCPDSDGYAYALGYTFSMIRKGCMNPTDIKYRLETFKA